MRDFTEEQALQDLRKIGVGIEGKWLTVDAGDLGLKMLAKVDFLVTHKGYKIRFRRELNV